MANSEAVIDFKIYKSGYREWTVELLDGNNSTEIFKRSSYMKAVRALATRQSPLGLFYMRFPAKSERGAG